MNSLRGSVSESAASCLRHSVVGWVLGTLLVASPAGAQINILTNRYDGKRTGANLNETKLTAMNVNLDQFGKLYSYPVDGSVYAQPLYVRGVLIEGTAHNVLYVATMNDKVYAFDADSSSPTPLWMRDFTNPPSVTAVPIVDIVGANNLNIVGNVGIQSTPVIDAATGTIYLVARTKENGAYVQRLHALDIATGNSRSGSPVTIKGSAPGTAPDSTPGASGSVITFDPKMHAQRSGLALTNGVVLISWASHEDATPYHGWIMGYDAATLAQVDVFPVTPDVYAGGIWQGGRAPTIDAAGNAYFATGNGIWDGTRNFGDSLLKFSVSRTMGLSLIDYFTPSNQATLNQLDDDLSGSGFTLLPGNLLLGGGKEGVLYLLNADNLGHQVPKDAQIPQKIAVQGGHVMGGAVYWNSSSAGPLVYNWSEDDVLKAYTFTGGKLAIPPFAQGQVMSPGHPGGSLTLSANVGAAGSGIVWASMPTSQDGIHGRVAGILRAFDAETLREIWTSEQNPTRDRVGTLMKFVPPVVVNGRVYIPNHDGAVSVYGALPTAAPDFSVSVSPTSRTIVPGSSGTFTLTFAARNGFAGTVTLSATGQPTGATVGFNPSSVSGSGTSTMTVSLPTGATGTSSIIVRAVSGTLTHTTTASVVAGTTAPAGSIGINFVGSSPMPMAAAETAGVINQPNWNNAIGASRSTTLALVDRARVATGATVTWSSARIWMTPITDQAGNSRLMRGYLDTTSTSTTTVTVAGLAQRAYDVYVYADGDNRTFDRTAAYKISGPGVTNTTVTLTDPASTNFGTTFTRATNSTGNYVKFTINATGFSLSAAPTLPVESTRRAPINGIQIVPAASAVADFTLSVSPASRSVTAGGSTTLTATIGAQNGFAGTVTLAASGAPTGTTTTFSPAAVTGSGTATITVATSSTTPAGTSTLTVKGTSGSLNHSATATLTVDGSGAAAGSIGIKFVGNSPTLMAASETAGVVAQSHWNNAAGATSGTPLALVDRSGASTTATVTWSAPGGMWMTPIADQAGNARLMKGYLDTTTTSSTTVTMAGLTRRVYDVYVYADGDNRTFDRTASYTISGSGITTTTIALTDAANTNFGTTFTRAINSAGNYVRFRVTATGFTIVAAPTEPVDGTRRAPVNGIQIVPVVATASIGINFVGASPTPMAASETAGVVDQANWNNATSTTRTTPLALVDASGAASTATATWSANGGWMLPVADVAGNRRMMKGYLDTSSTSSTTVSVAGLPSGDYDVYVHTDGDNHEFTRTAAYRISGTGFTASTISATDTPNTDFTGTFTQAAGTNGNYVLFSISGSGFTVTATPSTSTNATLRAPVNAIQIVPKTVAP